jgi:hypothetical protein
VTEEDFETTEGEAQDQVIWQTHEWRWEGGLRRFQKSEKENDLTWFLLVFYSIHDCRCNENSCFDKVFKFVEIYLVKIEDPVPDVCTANT